jgi:hypothetical protein
MSDSFAAGWSSPVARQAHNLKVTGSNPVPAPKPSQRPPHKGGRLRLRLADIKRGGVCGDRPILCGAQTWRAGRRELTRRSAWLEPRTPSGRHPQAADLTAPRRGRRRRVAPVGREQLHHRRQPFALSRRPVPPRPGELALGGAGRSLRDLCDRPLTPSGLPTTYAAPRTGGGLKRAARGGKALDFLSGGEYVPGLQSNATDSMREAPRRP